MREGGRNRFFNPNLAGMDVAVAMCRRAAGSSRVAFLGHRLSAREDPNRALQSTFPERAHVGNWRIDRESLHKSIPTEEHAMTTQGANPSGFTRRES